MDLRDFELEQRGDEERVPPGQNESRAPRCFLDLLEYRSDRVALAEPLARILILPRDDRIGVARAIEHDNELSALRLLDLTGQQLTHFVLELVADPVTLVFADALDDPLFHGHDRVSAELGEVDGDFHDVTDLKALVVPAGLFDRDLACRILHVGHHPA